MTGELYAVRTRSGGTIHAVFSSEGLAITHRAKLGLVETGYVQTGNPYVVTPLIVDEAAQLEPRYCASYATSIDEPGLVEDEIECGCDALTAALPVPEEPYVDESFASFNTYGWSAEEARAAMVRQVSAYVKQWYAEHDPDGELYG